MTTEQITLEHSEIRIYCDTGSTRGAWTSAAVAATFTLIMFVALPFSEIITSSPDQRMRIRPVETAVVSPTPPEARRLRPPEREPEPEETDIRREKPKLDMPNRVQAPRIPLPVSLNVPVAEFAGDFRIRLGNRLQGSYGTRAPEVRTDFGVNLDVDFAVHPEPVLEEAPAEDESKMTFALDELDRAPKPTLQIRPVYPYRARMRNIEGYVEVMFTLTPAGRVTDVEAVDSEPGTLFVDSALRAVERWRFEPGIRNGKPVSVRMQVKLRFELR